MINFVHNAKLHIALTILTEKKKKKPICITFSAQHS